MNPRHPLRTPLSVALALLLALLMSVLLAACNNGTSPDTPDSSDPSGNVATTRDGPYVTLFCEGSTDRKIIWPSRPADPEFNAYISLQQAFKACGVTITGDRDSVEEAEYEILIGETSRKESQEALRDLRDSDYVIRFFGEKLVIVGGSPAATYAAVKQFIEKYIPEDTKILEISGNTSITHTEEYPVMSMTINGVDISEFSIVTPYPVTRRDKYAAELLTDAIASLTGYTLDSYDDRKDARDHEIILGQTSRQNISLGDDEYAVFFNNGDLHITGGSGALMKALVNFIEKNLPAGKIGDTAIEIASDPTPKSAAVTYPPDATLDGRQLVALCDQKNASLVMVDLGAADPTSKDAIVWTWQPTAALGYTVSKAYGNRIDEAILRYSELYGTYVVCITSSSGYMCVAEYPSGKCLWEATASGYGPHSIDYLPNGNVAVVCSGNTDYKKGCVRLYTASLGKNSIRNASKTVYGAHGVLWDDDYQVLWVLGDNTLCAFRIGGTAKDPTLTEVTSLCTHSGISGGHSLSVMASDPDTLWITGSGVWTFKKSSGTLTTSVPGESVITASAVKSHDSYEDGTIIQAVATNVYAAHDTDTLRVYRTSDGGKTYVRTDYVFSDRAFYKARRVTAPYT